MNFNNGVTIDEIKGIITIKSDKDEISMTFDEFDSVVDKYKKKLKEPTFSELEDIILDMDNKIEELKSYVEACQERISENGYF